MGEKTIFFDPEQRMTDLDDKLYVIKPVGGTPAYFALGIGDACIIGREDFDSGIMPHIAFPVKSVSRVHGFAYVSKGDKKLYYVDLGTTGTYAEGGFKIQDHGKGNMMLPGGDLISVQSLIGPIMSGILSDKKLTLSQVEAVIKAIKNKPIYANGLPTGEVEPRDMIAKVQIDAYYPKSRPGAPEPKKEARFKLVRPTSTLELLITPAK